MLILFLTALYCYVKRHLNTRCAQKFPTYVYKSTLALFLLIVKNSTTSNDREVAQALITVAIEIKKTTVHFLNFVYGK